MSTGLLEAQDTTRIVYNVPMSEIFSDPSFNCRGTVAPVDVVGLARDIEKNGLNNPIQLRTIVEGQVNFGKFKYKIVAGHCRHMAYKVLNRETIPCFIEENMSEERALIINLGENLHRRDLNILQEARALERLKMAGFSIIEVSKELGKSTTWVNARYELLELPQEIQEAAAAGFIKTTQIREIHKLGSREAQFEAAKKIKVARINNERVPQIIKPKQNVFKKKIRDYHGIMDMMSHIQDSIGNNFGTRTLAWCAGEISDMELYHDIEDLAQKLGKKYVVPVKLSDML